MNEYQQSMIVKEAEQMLMSQAAERFVYWANSRSHQSAIIAPSYNDFHHNVLPWILRECERVQLVQPMAKLSNRVLEWPNGHITIIYGGASIERMRGRQHEKAWIHEQDSFSNPQIMDQFKFSQRLGEPETITTSRAIAVAEHEQRLMNEELKSTHSAPKKSSSRRL